MTWPKPRPHWNPRAGSGAARRMVEPMEKRTILELRGLSRRINSEFYLHDIDLTLREGEVNAIVGRNASGKSTLFSVIMGVFEADSGEIYIDGRRARIRNTTEAASQGLILTAQNQQMFENMTVYENIFFGQELHAPGLPVISNRRMIAATQELFRDMRLSIDPRAPASTLSPAQRQLILIARASISENAKIFLLDEPSTHLDAEEKQCLYNAINGLKARGKAFLIISHDLDEVLATADTVCVMEDGALVRAAPTSEFDKDALIEAVYGIKARDLYKREPVGQGGEVLRAEHLCGPDFTDVSLALRRGQITALMGAAGCGKEEFARALAGLSARTGTLCIDGKPLEACSPVAAINAGVVLALDAADESLIRSYDQASHGGRRDGLGVRASVGWETFTKRLGRTFGAYIGMRERGEYITGGNRRRELVERAMRRRGTVYILCDATAGIDIPARMRLYFEVNKLLQSGAAVLWLTSDADEAAGLCDETIVMDKGQIRRA